MRRDLTQGSFGLSAAIETGPVYDSGCNLVLRCQNVGMAGARYPTYVPR
ncbi:MAG: hypothetical protein JW727_01640 [Candidatus Aenigmarchaeota archaeon]|nr:hypothetical protein [Candidatus Aenigmarchaeota archaeon]